MTSQRSARLLAAVAGTSMALGLASAQAADGEKSFEIYGFAQLDYIQDFNRVNPDWESTLRPSRIPTSGEPYGGDGQAILSVRQSRLGVKGTVPTDKGPITTKFEFDMFGVGGDAGQTTIRLRHAYGQFGQFLAGQTNSVFMDGDIFPNTIDYWGPTGMVFYRNVQIRWTPIAGDTELAVALEDPGNDIDTGQFSRQLEQGGFTGQSDESLPDLTAHYRMKTGFGHFQVAGILRKIGIEIVDPDTGNVAYSDSDIGWGIDLTGTANLGASDVLRAGLVYGEGIASYMNDGGMDAGPDRPSTDTGAKVEAVPLTGLSVYLDHTWNEQFTSSIGYSFTEVDNTDGQTADAYNKGQYASANVLYTPVKDVLVGAELLWGDREDNGGNSGDDTRIQFSFKYNFGTTL
jgi:DcaP outer membrane protein